ncbi:MAG: hypothetical protein ACOVLG_02270 [Flavobacterium sp.]
MNYRHLLLILILVSCKPTASIVEENKLSFKNEKTIKYFANTENSLFTTYKSHALKYNDHCLYKDSTLIYCHENNFVYFDEIFDNRFLIISIGKKRNTGWAGVDTVDKDSTYIYDLKTKKKSFVSLKKTYFTYSKKSLAEMYHFNTKMDSKFTYHYTIDSINLDTNELFLVDPNFKIVEYKLKNIN